MDDAERVAAAAHDVLREADVELEAGLSAAELRGVERRFGLVLAPVHAAFLRLGLPVGPGWPDWRHGDPDALRARLAAPVEGVLLDVREHGFWFPGWGARPPRAGLAEQVARDRLAGVPPLVPLRGHRYLPGGEQPAHCPVLSVVQTDVIAYGRDLADWVRRELGREPGPGGSPRFRVPFWSDLAGGPAGTVPA